MVIHSPIFSGSITQDRNFGYADLSGSFTGSLTGSFKGTIDVQQATFDILTVRDRLSAGNSSDDIHQFTGSINVSGSVNVYGGAVTVDGVNVLDTALAYSIALG
jgi:hypothetical protein